jgi:hypothetical protein
MLTERYQATPELAHAASDESEVKRLGIGVLTVRDQYRTVLWGDGSPKDGVFTDPKPV